MRKREVSVKVVFGIVQNVDEVKRWPLVCLNAGRKIPVSKVTHETLVPTGFPNSKQ